MIHNEERSYLIERDPEMIQMVELVDKDIETILWLYFIRSEARGKDM